MNQIIWPERRLVSDETLIRLANDDIANGATSFTEPVSTVAEAIAVLEDSGTVTLGHMNQRT